MITVFRKKEKTVRDIFPSSSGNEGVGGSEQNLYITSALRLVSMGENIFLSSIFGFFCIVGMLLLLTSVTPLLRIIQFIFTVFNLAIAVYFALTPD